MSVRKVHDPETFRNGIRVCLSAKFKGDLGAASNLEKGVYNYALKEAERRRVVKKWDNDSFVLIYTNHLRSTMSNLTPENVQSVLDGTTKPHMLAFMTHQELCPSKWEELLTAKAKRDQSKFESRLVANTDSFTCRKCKSNQCTYYAMQTRSADEPMTLYIQCISCENRWKTAQ